jgi:hypothetical protein
MTLPPWLGTAGAPQNFSCFRCPAVVSTGGARLLAFAEAKMAVGGKVIQTSLGKSQ